MYVYSRVYLSYIDFRIDKINVYALPVWRLIKDIYILVRMKFDNHTLLQNILTECLPFIKQIHHN